MLVRLSFALVLVGVIFGLNVCSSDDGDGGTTTTIASFFPANNEVGSWAEEEMINADGINMNPTGVEVGKNHDEAVAILNGDAGLFTEYGFLTVGREFYTDGTNSLELRIWQMPSAEVATNIYNDLLTKSASYENKDWQDIALGDAGRFCGNVNVYWYNVRKGKYYINIKEVLPYTDAGKAAAENFSSAVLAKIP